MFAAGGPYKKFEGAIGRGAPEPTNIEIKEIVRK
jgi:hypothetical protein